METDRILQLVSLGQSLWLDHIRRGELENGETRSLIDRGHIRGMTSNPTIFNQAITRSHDYDEALRAMAWSGWDAEKIFWDLAVEDVRSALDLFAPLYEQTNGADGFVSIEVSPYLAHDTAATIAQAEQLWARVARPNLMVKIPATAEGIPAIRQTVANGLNINITLIFSRARYAEVMEAYLSGLEERVAAGKPVDHMASVASFFVSRVDSKVDKLLPPGSELRGKAAVANARLAYDDFRRTFSGERWEVLRRHGATLQRPLWASTSTKDPAYPDTMYFDQLVGKDTVDTVPPKTLEAVLDHGRIKVSVSDDLEGAQRILDDLEAAGISMEKVTGELELEGVASFSASVDELLKNIEARRKDSVRILGPLSEPVARRIENLSTGAFLSRLWAGDPTLWSNDPTAQAEIARRLGWLESPQKARSMLAELGEFMGQVRRDKLNRFLVIGMGGSSLAPEVLSSLFKSGDPSEEGAACLAILDSTDPEQVAGAAADFPPDKSLYIISSKSGGTAEVTAAFEYFWALSGSDGSRFIAITDAGTSLEQLARRLGFRRIFLADPTVGGRFSALTDFGLVPSALLGLDLEALIARAEWMQAQCGRDVPPARSPGVALGAVLAESALRGRDKLTILADSVLASIPHWIEQLVAESSGKNSKGILPVALEPLDTPSVYGSDRIFIYLRQTGELDTGVEALIRAGFPAITFNLEDVYGVGAEFLRWEVAIAAACHILGVNAFDQPDVQDSKDRTRLKIEEYRTTRRLEEGNWDAAIAEDVPVGMAANRILEFLKGARAGDYVAINAYLPRRPSIIDDLQRLRVRIREITGCAVTAGFGPRFQHSTGQFHKGGPNTGLFVQVVSDAAQDIEIPGQDMSFGKLIRAQALGDYGALLAAGRRVLRVHTGGPGDLARLVEVIQ